MSADPTARTASRGPEAARFIKAFPSVARVLVLGGAGFIGSHLCDRLAADGAIVAAIDNYSTGRIENLRNFQHDPQASVIMGNVAESIDVDGPFDVIYHLASPASPDQYSKLVDQTIEANISGTLNGLRVALKSGARFVYASTSAIYGEPKSLPQDEASVGAITLSRPDKVYSQSKRAGELIVQAFADEHGISVGIVRIFNCYGPRMLLDDGRVIPNFVSQALLGQPLRINGDGNQTRSFLYIDDLVSGLIGLGLASIHDPVNLGHSRQISIRELAELVIQTLNSGSALVHQPERFGDIRQRQPRIQRAQDLLKWTPRVDLETGIKQTAEWMANELRRTTSSSASLKQLGPQ